MIIKQSDSFKGNYDYAFIGLGYEKRCLSSLVNDQISYDQLIAFGYTYFNDVFNYQINKAFLLNKKAVIHELGKDNIYTEIFRIVNALDFSGVVNVFIDISVMTRQRLSVLLWILCDKLTSGSSLVVYYKIAQYVAPPKENSPVSFLGPIMPGFNSMKSPGNNPIAVIAGLGYERDKALGAISCIDTDEVFFYIPINTDQNYEEKIYTNNKLLLNNYKKNKVQTYDVTKPYSAYIEMKSLVRALRKDCKILILPLGPKIFTAISILVEKEYVSDVSVWRVSSEEKEIPIDRDASDELALLRVIF